MKAQKLVFSTIIIFFVSVLTIQCKKEKEDNKDNNNEQPSALLFTQAEKDTIFAGDSATAMRILNYFIPEDSVILRSVSKDVILTANDTIIKRLTDRMLTAGRSANGVGIAAPQVGILRNVMWVQRYDKGTYNNRPFEAYLNPVITAYSDTVVQRNDGCLSVPQSPEYPSVINYSYRALWVDVEYYLLNGQFVQERVTHTFTAHIFQHEIDHLRGIMYFDRFEPRFNENTVIIPYNPDDYNDIKLEMLNN